MDKMTFNFPLPPKELHPNKPANWQVFHRVRKKYKQECCEAVWGDLAESGLAKPVWESVAIQAEFFIRSRQPHDPDNAIAWIKAAIDSLEDQGILANDRSVLYLPPLQHLKVEGPPHLRIHVRRIDPDVIERLSIDAISNSA